MKNTSKNIKFPLFMSCIFGFFFIYKIGYGVGKTIAHFINFYLHSLFLY